MEKLSSPQLVDVMFKNVVTQSLRLAMTVPINGKYSTNVFALFCDFMKNLQNCIMQDSVDVSCFLQVQANFLKCADEMIVQKVVLWKLVGIPVCATWKEQELEDMYGNLLLSFVHYPQHRIDIIRFLSCKIKLPKIDIRLDYWNALLRQAEQGNILAIDCTEDSAAKRPGAEEEVAQALLELSDVEGGVAVSSAGSPAAKRQKV